MLTGEWKELGSVTAKKKTAGAADFGATG